MSILDETAHRPYPLPEGRWLMTQQWHDLLFAHWPVSPETLRALVPEQLEIDLYDGCGWIGVVPFVMRDVRPRGVPPLPWLSAFPELNVRTYVTVDGLPGIYFFSLDAGNPLAVAAARIGFHLPYYRARMRSRRVGDRVDYRSVRTHRGAPPAQFQASYRPHGGLFELRPGSLDHWFIERYRLYAVRPDGAVLKAEIHHPPWRLRQATADIRTNTMTAGLDLDLPDEEPLLHFSQHQHMVVWRPEAVRR